MLNNFIVKPDELLHWTAFHTYLYNKLIHSNFDHFTKERNINRRWTYVRSRSFLYESFLLVSCYHYRFGCDRLYRKDESI